MNRKMLAALLCGVLLGWGCAPNIPKAEYPVQLEKEYRVSLEQAWNAVNEVVNQSQGTMVTQDQASGFLSYSFVEPKLQKRLVCNVYVRQAGLRAVRVYFISYFNGRRVASEAEHDFYQKLDRLI